MSNAAVKQGVPSAVGRWLVEHWKGAGEGRWSPPQLLVSSCRAAIVEMGGVGGLRAGGGVGIPPPFVSLRGDCVWCIALGFLAPKRDVSPQPVGLNMCA